MAWRITARTLGFVNTLVLARLLIPADFGLVAMATAIAGIFESLSQFSVQDALVRRIEDDTRLHDCAFTIQAGRAVVTAAVMAFAAPLAAGWFLQPRLTPMVLVLAVLMAISGLENIGTVEFQRQMQFGVFFRILVIPRVLQVAATLLAAWYTQSYWALLVGLAVQRLSRIVVTYLIHPYRPRLSLVGWRELAGFSFWIWAAGMAGVVWDRTDTLIVGRFFGSATLGLYTIGIQVAIIPVVELVAPIASVLMAGFALSQRSGGSATRNAFPLAGALLLGVIPMALTLSAGAQNVVPLLLGAKWEGARPLVEIAAGICVFSPISYICMAVLVTIGQVRRQFFAFSVAAGVKVVVLYLAARSYDLDIVAAANVFASCVEALLFLRQLRIAGYARLRASAPGLLRIAVAGGVAATVLAQVGGAWGTAGGVALAGAPVLGNLLELVLLAAVAAATFGGSVVSLWLASGRPEGPERIVFRLASEAIRPKLRSAA